MAELGEIVDEVLSKMSRGEAIDVEQYAREHPDVAEVLRHALPALRAVSQSSFGGKVDATTHGSQPNHGGEPLEANRTIGDFRIIRELGRGGMGVVYEADEISLGRKVALKILPFAGIVDERALQRFRNEVRAAAGLDHPNIVSVHSAGEQRGVHYYAMQFVRGQTLAEVIHQLSQMKNGDIALSGDSISQILSVPSDSPAPSGTEPTAALARPAESLPAEDTVPVEQHRQQTIVASSSGSDPHFYRSIAILGVQAAGALQHAHDNGVLHRDIKPGNLMLDAQSQLYITDFGLARIETDAAMTMTGDLIGTLRYMSPEQALAKRVVIDQRCDIYSLGATLYELLALRPVFSGSDRQALLKQIAFEDPVKLRKIDRAIPADLETIIHKSLAKNPDERYTTAEEFASDLQAFIDHRPITARPPTPLQRLGKWSRRNRGLVAAGAVAAAICLVLLVVSNIMIAGQKALAVEAADSERVQRQNAESERDAAQRARDQAEDVTQFLVEAFRSPDPDKDGRTVTVVEVLDRAVAELKSRETIDPIRHANLLSELGKTYKGLSLVYEAVPLFEQSLTLRHEKFGEQHPDTLIAMNNLAIAYSQAGRTVEAFELGKKTLKIQREVLGDRHPDTLLSEHNLATFYRTLGRVSDAIDLHEKTLKTRREDLGERDPQTVRSMYGLARAYLDAGRYAEALELLKETYEISREDLGERHTKTVQYMNMLGTAYQSVGKLAKAAEVQERNLELSRELYGDRHRNTLTSSGNLAIIYKSLGRYEEAVQLLEHAVEGKREMLGKRHPGTLNTILSLANAYIEAGRYKEALELADETVKLNREVRGDRHPQTLSSMNVFMTVNLYLRRYSEAVEMGEQMLKLCQEELGEQHHQTLTVTSNLASAYGLMGRYSNAIELSEQNLKHQREKLGERHRSVLVSMANLARWYERAAQFPEAIKLAESTLKLSREVLGKLHPQSMSRTRRLAYFYYRAGRYEEAIEQYEQTLSLYGEIGSDNDPEVPAAKNGLAMVYSAIERYEDAAKLHEYTLQYAREQHGERHPNTISGMHSLAIAYQGLSRFEEAIELQEGALKLSRDVLGPWNRLTLSVLNTRARAYHAAGRYVEASQLFEEAIEFLKSPPDDVELDSDTIDGTFANVLTGAALNSLELNQSEKAEAQAREALQLRERLIPEHWLRFAAQSYVGRALLQQAKVDEAEQQLLDGFAGMHSRIDNISASSTCTPSRRLPVADRPLQGPGKRRASQQVGANPGESVRAGNNRSRQ